jgi:hypothetical protein
MGHLHSMGWTLYIVTRGVADQARVETQCIAGVRNAERPKIPEMGGANQQRAVRLPPTIPSISALLFVVEEVDE